MVGWARLAPAAAAFNSQKGFCLCNRTMSKESRDDGPHILSIFCLPVCENPSL